MQITTTDIIATLRAVVNKNTKLYKEDFKQDIKIFREAAKKSKHSRRKENIPLAKQTYGHSLCTGA